MKNNEKQEMMKKYIADSAVFIMGNCPVAAADMVTIPQVEDEMKSEEAVFRYGLSKEEGLRVEAVIDAYTDIVKVQASQTRDIEKLSRTDLGVLAKALEYKEKIGDDAVLITDDFAVQNIAARLGIIVMPVMQRVIRDQIVWQKQCIGCFRHFKEGDECPVCGSPLRKKMKKKLKEKPKTI
ncbi:MAG: NOB1 family endonuclease [Methanosarcinales archaeon]|jgi:UPF0271 protein|nr:NOB1 family endonuclease [Methanosarcinales archaeon]